MHTTARTNTLKLILSLIALGFAAGCATETKTADKSKTQEDPNDYVLIYPTGSRIPIKVKKSESKGGGLPADGQRSTQDLRTQQDMSREAKYDPVASGR